MKDATKVIGDCAVNRLDTLLADIQAETAEIVVKGDLPQTVVHYAYIRELTDSLKRRTSALEKHCEGLSYETLPTMMTNANVKTINMPDIGRVTVVVRWTAKMLDKVKSMEWLRTSGNEGIIQETVNANTLGAFAKAETLAGKPLPDHLFQVGTAQHISITKE
jgi:hypothetical protein